MKASAHISLPETFSEVRPCCYAAPGGRAAMLFMVIERFEGNDMLPVYRLAQE